MSELLLAIQANVNKLPDNEKELVSDGYHSFKDLYDHRIVLFIELCRAIMKLHDYGEMQDRIVWRSQKHSDGSVWDGWFLLGINTKAGEQITYHLPMSKWNDTNFVCKTIQKAPEFDGHTHVDVLARLAKL